jgi:uncharacterized iron-regulated membrane protein
MAETATIRSIFLTIHRWVAIGAFILLVPIALSGAALVFHDELDVLLNPSRYAITGKELLPPSAYLKSAATAVESGIQVTGLRFPDDDAAPVTAQARGAGSGGAGRPTVMTVYLDPPTGRVLDVLEFRDSLFGFLHRFHENLTVPDFFGRAIVGWVGVGLLFLSLSGIYLWWPRNGVFVPGLRWRRTPDVDTNLHHLFGFWISLPLALVSFTGIYLAFPLQARTAMSAIAPMTAQAPRPGFGPVARQTALTPERALAAASAIVPQGRPAALFLPSAPRDTAGNPSLTWRIQLRLPNNNTTTVVVADATGIATLVSEPLSGDRAAQWMRWLHEGSHSGVIWRVVVLLTGIFPAVLGITGILMWLRRRRNRWGVAAQTAPQNTLTAAE